MEIMLIIIFIVLSALVLTGIHIKDTEENKDAIEEINEVTKGFDSSCSYSPFPNPLDFNSRKGFEIRGLLPKKDDDD